MVAMIFMMTVGVAATAAVLMGVSAVRAIAGRRLEHELRRAVLDEIHESPSIQPTVTHAA